MKAIMGHALDRDCWAPCSISENAGPNGTLTQLLRIDLLAFGT
ncbi:unnamed protein product [Ixodes pacificus]